MKSTITVFAATAYLCAAFLLLTANTITANLFGALMLLLLWAISYTHFGRRILVRIYRANLRVLRSFGL